MFCTLFCCSPDASLDQQIDPALSSDSNTDSDRASQNRAMAPPAAPYGYLIINNNSGLKMDYALFAHGWNTATSSVDPNILLNTFVYNFPSGLGNITHFDFKGDTNSSYGFGDWHEYDPYNFVATYSAANTNIAYAEPNTTTGTGFNIAHWQYLKVEFPIQTFNSTVYGGTGNNTIASFPMLIELPGNTGLSPTVNYAKYRLPDGLFAYNGNTAYLHVTATSTVVGNSHTYLNISTVVNDIP
jgi:hypothetical protein